MPSPVPGSVTLRSAAVAAVLATLAGCRAAPQVRAGELDTLAAWMTGSFSSAAQASADPGEHADVRMHAIAVWAERTDGRWLYVERALASTPEEPHWQRVVRLHAEDAGLASDIYLLPGDAKRFRGAWRDPLLLKDVTPERLSLREGCTMHWTRGADGSFSGTTSVDACPSELHHARYSMSTSTVTDTLVTSWDQGFDASGRQVWGVTSGPYLFARNEPDPVPLPHRRSMD
jgi:hypothetical protein